MSRHIHSHSRSLWARSANFRRLAWTTGILALIIVLVLNRQSAPPATSTPPPAATPPAASAPAPAPPPPQYTPPPKAAPAASATLSTDSMTPEEMVAAALQRTAQQNANPTLGSGDVGILSRLPDDEANAPATTTVLDPNRDRLEDFPEVTRTWGSSLHVSPAGSGFNVAYMTDGDLSATRPYNPRDPARRAKPAQRPVTTIDSALELWRKEPQRLIAREHTGAIKIHYSWSEFKNIPSQDFAAYWAGKIQIRRAGYYRFRMTQSWSQTRIILNHHRIYEGGDDESPRVWLEPGSYTLEVEYLNNWHTTDFELALESAPAAAKN